MSVIRGMECVVYVNTSTEVDPEDAYDTPVWSLWPCVRGTTLNLEYDEADATCRGSGGWKQSVSTLGSLEVSGDAIKDKDDASFLAMQAAAQAQTVLDVLVLDGLKASADSDGWRLPVQIRSWTENQALDDVVTIDFTMKPARTAHAPAPINGPIT